MIVKLGIKGKHLAIPDGWAKVTEGICISGDQFANVGNPNKSFWQPAQEDDRGSPPEDFECLIRKQSALRPGGE